MDKIVETKSCKQCSSSFDITQNDRDFYMRVSPSFGGKKIKVPDPSLCPDCRSQRRLAWKNELQLYRNTCGGCGTQIISRFYEGSKILNYCNKCWSSDNWDALDYGREVDFTKSIFEQIEELISITPFQNLIGSLSNIENNSVYTNCTADIKDSYMVSESDFVENCYYGRLLRKSEQLFDCLDCSNSRYCYECSHGDNLYNCFYVTHSRGCRDLIFAHDCKGCSNAIACVGLMNKQHHILNKQVSPEEYERTKNELKDGENFKNLRIAYIKLLRKHKVSQDYITSSENCSGSIIRNSSNCKDCHDVVECQDSAYCEEINYSQDLWDISSYGSNSFLMYEGLSVGRYSHNLVFCAMIGRGENLLYCVDTKKSQHCFGCVNMKYAKYCIFNKQYSQEEYETLVSQIIEHMKQNGEWGEFFPASLSPFGYNETLAHECMPLTKQEVLDRGWNWSDYEAPLPKVDKIIPALKLPENIADIPDDILGWAIECEITKKPFRVIRQELEFYRKYNLPIPKRHPDQRRVDRIYIDKA